MSLLAPLYGPSLMTTSLVPAVGQYGPQGRTFSGQPIGVVDLSMPDQPSNCPVCQLRVGIMPSSFVVARSAAVSYRRHQFPQFLKSESSRFVTIAFAALNG